MGSQKPQRGAALQPKCAPCSPCPITDPFCLAGAGPCCCPGCQLKNHSQKNLSATTGERALSTENWVDKARGALLGSSAMVTAIQLPCSTSPCCLLSQSHERWEVGILLIKIHGFPLHLRNFSRTCVRVGRGHKPRALQHHIPLLPCNKQKT